MGNSPRYVGFIDPPYIVTLTDDSGAALNLTGCTSGSFTLTMINQNTGLSQQGVGVWTVTDAVNGKASYQWTNADMATAGPWWIYSTVKLPSEPSPREFDPELILILPGTVGAGAAPPGVLPNPAQSLPFLNIRDYGGVGDNATDCTTAIFNARAAARALGGATILYGPGIFLSGNQDFTNDKFVYHDGSGKGTTTIKLKNGANTDLFSAQTSSINLAAVVNTGIVGTLYNFGFSNMTLDGNKANQTSGTSYPLRFYGYDFLLENIEILNGYSGGALIDWNGGSLLSSPSDQMDAELNRVKIHDCTGIGLQMGGPHDSHLKGVLIWNCTSNGFHFTPNATGTLVAQCHPYHKQTTGGVAGAVGMLIEAVGVQLSDCMIEYVADAQELVILANDCSAQGGTVFMDQANTATGIQLGQLAGDVVIPGQILQSAGVSLANAAGGCSINTKIRNCNTGMKFRNESNNNLRITNFQTAGGFLNGGASPSNTDLVVLEQSGLAGDGTINTLSSIITPVTGIFIIDQFGNFFPASIATNTIGSTATSQVLTTGATISKLDGGVIHVTEAGNVTGIILAQAHNYWPDIRLIVINESAFTVTFATEATSFIAGSTGANVVIAAKSKAIFWYDQNTARWYL